MMRYLLKAFFPVLKRSPKYSIQFPLNKVFSSNSQVSNTSGDNYTKQLEELSTRSADELSIKDYEANRRKAADLVKVFINYVEHTALENCIKCLYVSISYKIVNLEFLKKFENKILKKMTDIEPKDISRIIFGLYNLGYTKSTKLNFMIERSIKKHFDNFTTNDFAIIFKSYAKAKLSTTGLINFFNYFIDKNINNFNYFEAVDILIHYPRIITPDLFKHELFFKLYSQTVQGFDKLEINRLVNLYFVLYGGIDQKIKENIKYDPRLLQLIITKESNIKSKHVYLIILAHHFSRIPMNNELATVLKEFLNSKIGTFLPEEINGIINILNDEKNKDLFSMFDKLTINTLYLDSIKEDLKSMDSKEIILYLHTIIPNKGNHSITKDSFKLLENFDNTLKYIKESLRDKEPQFDLVDINNILQLIPYNFQIGEYTVDRLSKLTLMNLRRSREINFKDYNMLMTNMISNGNNSVEFWTEYLNYVKLFSVKKYDDYIMLKSNLQVLENKVKGNLGIKETLLFLENRYEIDGLKSVEKI